MNIAIINNKIGNLSETDKFSGCVLLTEKDGNELYSFCCGYASKEYEIRNNIDTKFNVASVGKPITGVAITKLIEERAIEPRKAVGEYIDLKNDVFRSVTIEQLLTHTSGLGDYFQQAYNSPYTRSYIDLDDYMDIVESATLDFMSGEKWAYSNIGYLVLGMLIEKITGQSYYSYIEQNIFQPAGMIDSGFWLYNEPVKNRASGYSFDDERGIWRNRASMPVLRGTSSGGWFSTVGDLSKFMVALLNNKFTISYFTDIISTPKPELNALGYGYGFFISDEKLCHGGNGTGIGAQLAYYKTSGYILAVLCNYSSGADDIVRIFDDELI